MLVARIDAQSRTQCGQDVADAAFVFFDLGSVGAGFSVGLPARDAAAAEHAPVVKPVRSWLLSLGGEGTEKALAAVRVVEEALEPHARWIQPSYFGQ